LIVQVNKDPVESAFFDFIDLCLEDHQNFQDGHEDARTAFNEKDEDEEPFDIAEHAFFQGYKTVEPMLDDALQAFEEIRLVSGTSTLQWKLATGAIEAIKRNGRKVDSAGQITKNKT
jgi:hypothetical protein